MKLTLHRNSWESSAQRDSLPPSLLRAHLPSLSFSLHCSIAKKMHRRLSPSFLRLLFQCPRRQFPAPESSYLFRSIAAISSLANLIHPFSRPQSSFPAFSSAFRRNYSGESSGGQVDVNKVVDEINLKFAEAREEIESAMDSKETVYFNEEADTARDAVKEVLDMFEGLLSKVEEKEKLSLQRSMGLKMEQLKAELQQLND